MRYAASGGEGDGRDRHRTRCGGRPARSSGRYLAPWLAARDDEATTGELPEHQGVPVQMDLERSFVSSR